MASKSKSSDSKTVTLYSTNGSKVTVSEELAGRLGSKWSKDKPKGSS